MSLELTGKHAMSPQTCGIVSHCKLCFQLSSTTPRWSWRELRPRVTWLSAPPRPRFCPVPTIPCGKTTNCAARRPGSAPLNVCRYAEWSWNITFIVKPWLNSELIIFYCIWIPSFDSWILLESVLVIDTGAFLKKPCPSINQIPGTINMIKNPSGF